MGRPRKNESEEFFIGDNSKIKHSFSKVKVPFFNKVTLRVEIGKDKSGKSLYATTEQIMHESQKTEYEVINSEPLTISISDICPDCKKPGIPKIERKSNKYDYHARAGSALFDKPTHKVQVDRQDEYRLTYDHKVKDKLHKCVIAKFDQNQFLFRSNSQKINELQEHFFPQCIQWLKKLP